MREFTVTYDDGSEIRVVTDVHAPAGQIIRLAGELRSAAWGGASGSKPVLITRDAGSSNALVVWEGDLLLKTTEPPTEAPKAEPITLFVSIWYGEDGDMRPGNTLIEIECAPNSPIAIESLQKQIAEHIDCERVVLSGWQQVDPS